MNPGKYNITLWQGSTWSVTPVWKINGVAVDVTGYSAKMQVRTDASSASVIVELSSANGRIVVGTTDGSFALTLSNTVTAALAEGQYVYDLEVTAPDGTVTKLLRGAFSVVPEVTR